MLDSFDFGMVHVYQEKNIRIDNPGVEKEFIAGKDSRKQQFSLLQVSQEKLGRNIEWNL